MTRNIIGFTSFAIATLFLTVGILSIDLLPTTQIDMMTPNDWLRAITTVVMPMLVGAVLTFMAVLIIE